MSTNHLDYSFSSLNESRREWETHLRFRLLATYRAGLHARAEAARASKPRPVRKKP